jgi:hypothetical protein
MSNKVKPKVTIEIAHKDQYKDSFFERCVGQAVRDQRLVDQLPEWLPYHLDSESNPASFMVWYYEDKTLKEMRAKSGAAYERLYQDIQWIATTLNCNIVVYLGHKEICENFVEKSYKPSLVDADPSNFQLPTVFLIIACYTEKMADTFNTDPFFVEKNIAFFGFQDFMHIHEGEIYGCKEVHKAPPSLTCTYDTVGKNVVSLLEIDKSGAKKTITNVKDKKVDQENPLVKCCEAKEAAMYDLFIKYLDQRKCVKFPKEALAAKFRLFVTNPQKRYLLESHNTTFKAEDGIACKDGSCMIPNPYVEAAKKSKVFNDMSTKPKLYKEILGAWKEGLDEFTAKLKTIKDKDGGILTYKFEDKLPILAILLENKRNYNLTKIYELFLSILKTYGKYLNLDVSYGELSETVLHSIRKSKLPEGKQYFLFKKIYELVRPTEREELFFMKDGYNQTPLEADIHQGKKLPLLILLFYIQFFGPKLKHMKSYIAVGFRGNLLHSLLMYPIESYTEEFDYKINTNNTTNRNIHLNFSQNVIYNCIKGLLDIGVDPNATLQKILSNNHLPISKEEILILESLKPLQLYMFLYKPPYEKELINLFLSYGMTNTDKFFSTQYDHYTRVIDNPEIFEIYLTKISNQYDKIHSKYNNNSNQETTSKVSYESHRLKIYLESFYYLLPFIDKNMKKYKNYLPSEYGVEIIKETIDLFKQAILFFSLSQRKNYKLRIEKTRKNTKAALNKSLKNYSSNLTMVYNIDRLLRSRMKEIEEFIKYGTFTKEQKEMHRKDTLEYRQMNLPPKAVYDALGNHLEYLQNLSSLNKEINKVRKQIEEGLAKLKDGENTKNGFRKQVNEILANDEDFTTEEKLEEIKKLLRWIEDWPYLDELDSIRQEVNAKVEAIPNNNRKQRYKNEIDAMAEDEELGIKSFMNELRRILREISV